MNDDTFCPDCKKCTKVVLDHSAGDTICTDCGLVLEAYSIEETREWRTFTDDSRDNDPVRVGEACNPLLESGGLQTVISRLNGSRVDGMQSPWRRRWKSNCKELRRDQGLVLGFSNIAAMADRLGLVATIKARANEIYKKVDDAKSRGRNMDVILAACLYIACREEGMARTLSEICTISNGATKSEIVKAVKYIEQLGVEMKQSIEMAPILKRFCSQLGMKFQEMKAVEDTVQKIQELDIRRSPTSIAAAVIYMITQLSTEKKPLKDISVVTKVAESTIRDTYKDLYPHARKIIQASYAEEEDLKKLR